MQKLNLLKCTVAGLLMLAVAMPAFAEEKTRTITGEGKCGKCAMKETDKCQNVIQVEKNGKKTLFYLTQNDISKKFHEEYLCKGTKKVTATGTVKTVDGKREFTATKIDLAKDKD